MGMRRLTWMILARMMRALSGRFAFFYSLFLSCIAGRWEKYSIYRIWDTEGAFLPRFWVYWPRVSS